MPLDCFVAALLATTPSKKEAKSLANNLLTYPRYFKWTLAIFEILYKKTVVASLGEAIQIGTSLKLSNVLIHFVLNDGDMVFIEQCIRLP